MKTIIAAALLVISTTASAQFVNGNRLLSNIDGSSSAETSFAMGYIAGVADALDDEWFCLPSRINLGQARDIVRRYLVSNPDIRHMHAGALTGLALQEAFPCAKKKGSGT